MSTNHFAEKLVSEGHAPARAEVIAASAARAPSPRAPTEAVTLAARVHMGEATIIQLADAIERQRRLGRDDAFACAERMLRDSSGASTARLAAVPLDASAVGTPGVSIVALADKIATEQKIDREAAFAMAEREIRAVRSAR
jgi:hypothetical protein